MPEAEGMATKAKAAGHEKTLYLFALVVRVVMILWGEWQVGSTALFESE